MGRKQVFDCKKRFDVAMNQFNWTTVRSHGKEAVDARIYALKSAELLFNTNVQREKRVRLY